MCNAPDNKNGAHSKRKNEKSRRKSVRNKRALFVAIACLMALGVCPMGAYAQDYPNQPIKLIIPNPPGGPGDIIARAFTEKAAQTLGKPFIFDYRSGASTTIGTAVAAKAEPDGYTILGLPTSGAGADGIKKLPRSTLETECAPIAGIR